MLHVHLYIWTFCIKMTEITPLNYAPPRRLSIGLLIIGIIDKQLACKLVWLRETNRPVTPKSVPPKIGPAGPILAKNLPKVVPRTTFCCQNQSGRTNFGSQNWSPLANFGPPTLLFPILHYRVIPLGICIGNYSYS